MKSAKLFKVVSILTILLWGYFGINAWAGQAENPMVQIKNLGEVMGSYESITLPDGDVKTVRLFSAIPYAEPMTPENRWRASVKKKPFKETPYDATIPCPACPQLSPEKNIQEDCLYLRIATPENASPGAKLPVMVFIHGGAFETGGANSDFYNSGANIVAHKDVIVVTINYRLGILGFLVHHGNGENDTSSGNFGLGDQKLAIEFVRENIGAFGGDEKNITLFGESAGAMSIGFHLMMEDQDHFDAAIMESNLYGLPYLTEAQGAKLGKLALEKMSCQDLDGMRKMKVDELLKVAMELGPSAINDYGMKGIFCFKPVIQDKTFGFKQQPIRHIPDKPVILGINQNEGPMIALGIKRALELCLNIDNLENMTETQFQALLNLLFKKENAQRIFEPVKALYPAFMNESECSFMQTPTKYYTLFSRILSDFFFTSANLKYAFDAAPASSPLYAYHFTHVSSCDPWPVLRPQCRECVCHTAELPYLFGTFTAFNPDCTNLNSWARLQPQEYTLSERMMDFWVGFAATRNPGAPWPEFLDLPYAAQLLDLNIEPSPVKATSLGADAFYQLYLPILESEN